MGKDSGLEKLLLMSCRSPFLDDAKIYAPMGNLYLKNFVNTHRPQTEVTLGDDNYNQEFTKYDAVGISIMTPQRHEANNLAKKVKKNSPSTVIIAGGPHIKHYKEEAIQNPLFDYVVIGDGEKALVSILEGYQDRVVRGNMSKQDIYDAPRPDRTSDDAIKLIKGYNYTLDGRDSTTMMMGRGCPERCTFCEDAMTSIKWSSLDNIKGELDDIQALGYNGIYIFDDLFAIAKPKVEPIVKEIGKRGMIFRANAQARYFTKWGEDMAKLLADNGCHEIAFGAETGSQKILDNINKRTTIAQNYQTVEFAKKHGIKVKAFILLGLPGEDSETLQSTEKFISTSGIDDFQAAIYMPYKGTQIRDSIDRGEDIDLQMTVEQESGAYGVKGGNTVSEVRTKALSSEDLKRFRDYLVERYRPGSHENFFDTHPDGNI